MREKMKSIIQLMNPGLMRKASISENPMIKKAKEDLIKKQQEDQKR